MRVVGGTHRGRRLRAPSGTGTRPTTDRVREAVFSSLTSLLGADLGGGSVLDAFAGSGALGIEALSRGAGSVTFIEKDRRAIATIKANLADLGELEHSRIVTGDVMSCSRHLVSGSPFSLILLDPPYKLDAGHVADLLERLASQGGLVQGCIVLWEFGAGDHRWPPGFEVVRSKKYGGTVVDIAEWAGGGSE